MKKLMYLAVFAMVLTVFNACTKDDLPVGKPTGGELSSKNPEVYLENDYLVVKNFEAVDSLKKILQNKSITEQAIWENQLGLKSAKIFRVQSSDKLAGFQKQQDAENYLKELISDGYFSMNDSSMCYPFYNHSWDCVLNKNGVIKIGDVLYCFQKDAQIAILDGKPNTLNQFLKNSQSYDKSKVKVIPFQRLKSTTPTNYGKVADIVQYNSNRSKRFIFGLYWEPITESILNVYGQWVTVQIGNKYQLNYHNETKSGWWWNDNRTIFYMKHITGNIGGNYDPIEGMYYNNWINTTPWTDFNTLNTTTYANYYVDVYVALFNNVPINVYTSYPGPIINQYSCQGSCDTFGKTNPVTLSLN